METISQKITRELTKEVVYSNTPTETEISKDAVYRKLHKLGFEQVQEVKGISSLSDSAVRGILENLAKNPNYKVVTFKTLMGVLEKYNLYLGPIAKYTKEIPLKNAQDIIRYSEEVAAARSKRDLPKKGEFPASYYICNKSSGDHTPTFFICAPREDFEQKNLHSCGRDLYYNELHNTPSFKFQMGTPNPDPIIVRFLAHSVKEFDMMGCADIVTAWDREARDPEIVNPFLN